MGLRTDEYFRGVDEIKGKLDKIIELLEFTKAHHHIQVISSNTELDAIDPGALCNCGQQRSEEITGGWFCPMHGQQF